MSLQMRDVGDSHTSEAPGLSNISLVWREAKLTTMIQGGYETFGAALLYHIISTTLESISNGGYLVFRFQR